MNDSQNAITVIYREHWQKLYIHAYNLLNDEESAKDVVNDVFCSVLESSERLTTEEAPQMRTVVEEFFLNEKKCAEISEKLRISDNTVRTHIARALKILRKQLTIFF